MQFRTGYSRICRSTWLTLCGFAISIALYASGIRLFLPDRQSHDRRALFPLALSFFPFVEATILGGQASAVAFASMAFAIRSDLDGKYVRAGALLSLCAYKPTLLLIVLPCMLFRAEWR